MIKFNEFAKMLENTCQCKCNPCKNGKCKNCDCKNCKCKNCKCCGG